MKRYSKRSLKHQHHLIRREFKRQASEWAKERVSPDLQWVARQLPLRRNLSVLDVAAGTGLLSQAVAPKVKRVVALDVTLEMITEGYKKVQPPIRLPCRSIAESTPFYRCCWPPA